MAKIVLVSENTVIAEYPLDKEVLTIGRVPDNDVQIESMAVSAHHAKIVTIENDSFLEDLGSTNGTYVNGKKIRKHALDNGDLITIGTHLLRYDDTQLGSPQAESSTTVQTDAPFARLRIISGRNTGRELPLTKKMTTLGETGEHVAAILKRQNGLHFIHIDGGEAGQQSMLNGQPIDTRAMLHDRDVIEVAGVRMELLMNQ